MMKRAIAIGLAIGIALGAGFVLGVASARRAQEIRPVLSDDPCIAAIERQQYRMALMGRSMNPEAKRGYMRRVGACTD